MGWQQDERHQNEEPENTCQLRDRHDVPPIRYLGPTRNASRFLRPRRIAQLLPDDLIFWPSLRPDELPLGCCKIERENATIVSDI